MISGDVIYCYSIDTHNLSRKETLQGPNASGDEFTQWKAEISKCTIMSVVSRNSEIYIVEGGMTAALHFLIR